MSQPQPGINDDAPLDITHEELMAEMFAHCVIQNTNMALLFLGQTPHPQTGKREFDPDAARLFIGQLEMLDVKTQGNLSADEQKLLQQSLMHLRMSFVQAVENPVKAEAAKPEPAAPAAPAPEPTADSGESNKRFTKRF
jgi:hypothetical protein